MNELFIGQGKTHFVNMGVLIIYRILSISIHVFRMSVNP